MRVNEAVKAVRIWYTFGMTKKEHAIIFLLTVVAIVAGYKLTYSGYCGWEGCASGGGFPLQIMTMGGAGFGSDPSLIGIAIDGVFYYAIIYIAMKAVKRIFLKFKR